VWAAGENKPGSNSAAVVNAFNEEYSVFLKTLCASPSADSERTPPLLIRSGLVFLTMDENNLFIEALK
jgi:hypothetical protein